MKPTSPRSSSASSSCSSDSDDDDDDDDEINKFCLNCRTRGDFLKVCARCKSVYFCNSECQREVHREHSKVCVSKAPAPLKLPKGMPAPKTEEEKKTEIENETKRIEIKLLPNVLNNNFGVGDPPEEALVDEPGEDIDGADDGINSGTPRICGCIR